MIPFLIKVAGILILDGGADNDYIKNNSSNVSIVGGTGKNLCGRQQ